MQRMYICRADACSTPPEESPEPAHHIFYPKRYPKPHSARRAHHRVIGMLVTFACVVLIFWSCGGSVDEPGGTQEPSPDAHTSVESTQEPTLAEQDTSRDGGESMPEQEQPPTEKEPPSDRDPLPTNGNRTVYTMPTTDWTETAVRKVLQLFAYGGFASDAQIKTWAGMKPEDAIDEILSLQPHNPKVSPSDPMDRLDATSGKLAKLGEIWSSQDPSNPTLAASRSLYQADRWDALSHIWVAAATRRGLNPVRHKIGLWETNYHMAVNRRAQVSNPQILKYYDAIMDGLAEGKSYQDVMAGASLSAAVATQYNHKENVFKDGKFIGNEDFAREFFQLFFGILGSYDPEYHEFTSIRNTAKALTDMSVDYLKGKDGGYWGADIVFGTKYHYPGDLEILKTTIVGKTAQEKIQNLAQVAMQHPESLENLPILIVRGLADDNLTQDKIDIIRKLWAEMSSKNLLLFLKRYAISTAFHHPTRRKLWSSFDRNLIIHNQLALGNQASYLELYPLYRNLVSEGVYAFEPQHDVFGHQTGIEAYQSPDIFRDAYNRSTEQVAQITQTHRISNTKVVWEKNWATVVPKDADGSYRVKTVAEWLWQRWIADGGKNFGTLERAHVYALLVSGTDLAYWLDPKQPSRVYTKQELESDRFLQERISDAGKALLDDLVSQKVEEKRNANARIGMAIAFIMVTPYMHIQEGK